jgi:hypothetical protein
MPPSDDSLIRTSADELLDIVKKSAKISVEDAARRLKMPLATVQSLVDFLVEEKVFGIEYKFTTPFIYLYKEDIQQLKGKSSKITLGLITKEQFYQKAKARNTPYEHIEVLWRKYLKQNLVNIREEFIKSAKLKKIPENKIEDLWKKYLVYL